MEQEQGVVTEGSEGSRQGLRLIVGAGLGYLVGKAIFDRPILGTLVGGVLALLIRAHSGE